MKNAASPLQLALTSHRGDWRLSRVRAIPLSLGEQKLQQRLVELLWILQHGKMAGVRLNNELRPRDLPRNLFGVIELDDLVMLAVGDGGRTFDRLQLLRGEIRLRAPHHAKVADQLRPFLRMRRQA